eukprot:gnl/TRDRNA2_/TRDRNA2_142536_c0_seq1.p3 gnl/TRDRNA2_/TRDRNA2_142536_c0~~gnl/TRDRNA2_/TRDRNA2_142536_c0_seq1.p3  ORF type:complete len:104 (+),score=9.87 gnl/TRDRNA2_/TRDRNA2_142536_c0_seq1:212-523(+)
MEEVPTKANNSRKAKLDTCPSKIRSSQEKKTLIATPNTISCSLIRQTGVAQAVCDTHHCIECRRHFGIAKRYSEKNAKKDQSHILPQDVNYIGLCARMQNQFD